MNKCQKKRREKKRRSCEIESLKDVFLRSDHDGGEREREREREREMARLIFGFFGYFAGTETPCGKKVATFARRMIRGDFGRNDSARS